MLLAGVAGFVDAVGFLTLHTLFTAHMSGNSAELGVRLGRGDLGAAVPLASAVLLFVFGIAGATILTETAARRAIRSTTAMTLGLQGLLIAAFLAYAPTVVRHGAAPDHGARGFYPLAGLLIVSMGLQTATLQKAWGRTVRTTYVSGVLTNLAQEAVNYLFWLRDGDDRPATSHLGGDVGLGSRGESRRRVVLLGGIWCAYAAAAVLASYATARWGTWAMGIPLAVVAATVVLDLVRPIHFAGADAS